METPAIASSEPTADDERRFRLLVDANVVGVTISDDERVLESNDAWLKIVGRTREELERGEISWRAITAPEWAAQDDQVTRRLDAEGWVAPYEKEYIRPDGTRAPVLLSGVTLDRDPLRVVAIVIDLSERYAADRDRELMLAREREARREAELAADRTARLQRVTAALSAAGTADEVGEVVVGQTVDDFYAAAGALAFRVGDEVQMRYDRGFEDTAMAAWRRYPLHLNAPVCDALRTGEPVYLETFDDWERYPELRAVITGAFESLVAIPIAFGGRVFAALVLCSRTARRFMAGDRTFLGALADQAANALERARLYEERAYVARTLQEGLLPDQLAEIPGLEVAIRYHSIADGGRVGGDFYDCFDMSPGRWLVAVGDVAGKGTAAAVLTGLARHTLRAIAFRDDRPDDMLRFLNEALLRQSSESAFCTIGLVRLDRVDGRFEAYLAFGGHPYPLRVREGGRAEDVVVRGTLLGVEDEPVIEPVALTLEAGDTLVLYTDGVVDARDAAGGRFGEARLRAAVEGAAGGSAEAVAEAVDQAVAAFEPERTRDDRAILVLRVSG